MADLKLRLKVNLKAGSVLYDAGRTFEGTLDTFPKDIQKEYLDKRWDVIEVMVNAKGKAINKMPTPSGRASAKVEPTTSRPVKDSSEGQTGTPVPSPTTIEQTLGGTSVISVTTTVSKEEKEVKDDDGDSGTATEDTVDDKRHSKATKTVVPRSHKAKPKLKVPKSKTFPNDY